MSSLQGSVPSPTKSFILDTSLQKNCKRGIQRARTQSCVTNTALIVNPSLSVIKAKEFSGLETSILNIWSIVSLGSRALDPFENKYRKIKLCSVLLIFLSKAG